MHMSTNFSTLAFHSPAAFKHRGEQVFNAQQRGSDELLLNRLGMLTSRERFDWNAVLMV